MQRFDWKQVIRPNIIMLRLIGLWPKENTSYGKNLYTLYVAIVVSCFQIPGLTLPLLVNLFYTKNDLKAVTAIIYVSLMCISIVLKSCCLIKNSEVLKMLMITVNSDLFQPKCTRQKELILPIVKSWQNIARAVWFFAIGYSIFVGLFPVLDSSYKEYKMPYLAWYPYNYKRSPHYEITYIYQVISMNYLSAANVNSNTLIAALNMYIAAQFEIVTDDLRHLCNPNSSSSDVSKKLLQTVHHHRELLKFADSASKFYNWLIFLEFFVDGFSIGITMFQLTLVSPSSGEFHSFLQYANAISAQIFMQCWFGNEVEMRSSKLAYAIYESDWIDLSPEMKRNIIIFTIRAQRQRQVSAFGLFNLNLENFMKIMRTAWSYFALLRQVS